MKIQNYKILQFKEAVKPYFDEHVDLEMLGADIRIKRFKIYEDANIKVQRTEEPTYSNEFNNYIEVLIKNGAILMHFPIGGYINKTFAIESACKIINTFFSKK